MSNKTYQEQQLDYHRDQLANLEESRAALVAERGNGLVTNLDAQLARYDALIEAAGFQVYKMEVSLGLRAPIIITPEPTELDLLKADVRELKADVHDLKGKAK